MSDLGPLENTFFALLPWHPHSGTQNVGDACCFWNTVVRQHRSWLLEVCALQPCYTSRGLKNVFVQASCSLQPAV